MSTRLLTIVAPALDEEEGIGEFIRQVLVVADSCPQWRWEVLIVDDGSTDSTAEVVRAWRQKDSRVCLLSLSRNFGQEAAIMAGITHARGDAVVTMDADLQDPPTLIPSMLEKLDSGYDMIYAKYTREGEGWFKTWSAAVYYKLMKLLSDGTSPPANVNNFRVISRRVADIFLSIPERDRYARGLFVWLGMTTMAIEFTRPPRPVGKTKYNVFRMIGLGWSGITSFSTAPLRWAIYLGFLALLFAVLCVGYVLWSLFAGLTIPGWTSILGVVLIFSGVQLVMLGIIGEYVGKVLKEVKNRPLYVTREFLGNHESPD